MAMPKINRAESARAKVVATMPEELCISLPVPVEWNGVYVDAFFTFSITTVGMTPYPARDCRIVLENGDVVIEPKAFGIDAVAFDTSRDRILDSWNDAYRVAYDNYDGAYMDCVRSVRGTASATFVHAIKKATPASQLPYYVAMNPWLFGEV